MLQELVNFLSIHQLLSFGILMLTTLAITYLHDYARTVKPKTTTMTALLIGSIVLGFICSISTISWLKAAHGNYSVIILRVAAIVFIIGLLSYYGVKTRKK